MKISQPKNGRPPLTSKVAKTMLKMIPGIGIIGLSVGIGALALAISSLFSSISNTSQLPKGEKPAPVEVAQQTNEIVPVEIKETAAAKISAPIQTQANNNAQEMVDSAERWDEDEVHEQAEAEDDNDGEDMLSPQHMAAEKEIRQLKEALPGNVMIPGKKTEEELDQMLESIKKQQYIQDLINEGEASGDDLRRYYELQAKRYEDEIALIDYCDQIISESQSEDDISNPFCKTVIEESGKKREANEASLEYLRQDLL